MSNMNQKTFICRFCLSSEGGSVNVFDHFITNGVSVHSWVSLAFGLKISHHDGLTPNICLTCLLKVYQTYFFEKKCQESENVLISAYGVKSIRQQEISNRSKSDGNFLPPSDEFRSSLDNRDARKKSSTCAENTFSSSEDGRAVLVGIKGVPRNQDLKSIGPLICEKRVFSPPESRSLELYNSVHSFRDGQTGQNKSLRIKVKPLSDMMIAPHNFSTPKNMGSMEEVEEEHMSQNETICPTLLKFADKHVQNLMTLYEVDKEKLYQRLKASGHHDTIKRSLKFDTTDSNEIAPRSKQIPEEKVLLKKRNAECEPGIPSSDAPETNVPRGNAEENISTNSINFSFVEKYASLKNSNKFSDGVTSTDPKLSNETKIAQNKMSDYYLEFVKFLDGNISDKNSLLEMFRKVHDMNLKEQSILNLGTKKPIDIFQAFQSAKNQCETTSTDLESYEESMVDSSCDKELNLYPYSKKGEVGHVPADLPVSKDLASSQFPTKGAGHPFSKGLVERSIQSPDKTVDQDGSVSQTDGVNAGENEFGIYFGKNPVREGASFLKEIISPSVGNGVKSSTKLKIITHKIPDPITDKGQENLNVFSEKEVDEMNSPNYSFWSCPKILPKPQSSNAGARFSLSEKIFSQNFQSCGEQRSAVNSAKSECFSGAQSNMSSSEILIQPKRHVMDSVSRELFPEEKESAHVEIYSSPLYPKNLISSPRFSKEAGLSEDGSKKNTQVIREPNGMDSLANNSINISDSQPTSTVKWNDTPVKLPPPLVVKENQSLNRRKTSPKSESSSKETHYILIDLEPEDSNQSSECEDLNKSLSTNNCINRRKMAASGECDEILDKSLGESCPQSPLEANGKVFGREPKQKTGPSNAIPQEKCNVSGKIKPESDSSHDSIKSEVICTSSDSDKSLSNSKRCDTKTKSMVDDADREKEEEGRIQICETNGKPEMGNLGTDYRDKDNKTHSTDNKIKKTPGNSERDKKEGKTVLAKTPNKNSANFQKQCGKSSRKRPRSPPDDGTEFQNKKSNPTAKFPSPIKDESTLNEGNLFACFSCPMSFSDSSELVEHVLDCRSNYRSNGSSGTPNLAAISKETEKCQRININSPEVGKSSLHSMRHMVVESESPVALVNVIEAEKVSTETSSVTAENFEVNSSRPSMVQCDSVCSENGINGVHLSGSKRAKCDFLFNFGSIVEEKNRDQSTYLPNNRKYLLPTPKPLKNSEIYDERKPYPWQRFYFGENVNESVGSSSEQPPLNDFIGLKFPNTMVNEYKNFCSNRNPQHIANNNQRNGGSAGMLIPSPFTSKRCKSSEGKKEKPCVGVNCNKINQSTKDVAHLLNNSGKESTNSKKKIVNVPSVIVNQSSEAKKREKNKRKNERRKLRKALNKANVIPCLVCSLRFSTHALLLKHMEIHQRMVFPNVQVPPPKPIVSDTADGPPLLKKSQGSGGLIESTDKHITGAMSDEKVDELRNIIRQQLGVSAYTVMNSDRKKFRCPVCLNLFSKLCDVTSHIVNKHHELSNEWPTSLLFSPDILKKLNKNPVNDASPAHTILPQTSKEQSLLQGSIKCDQCKCEFSCKSALLKHSIWAHPTAANNPC